MTLVACYVFAYFLGAVPFGYLVAKSQGIDIRKVGSGNIGATNIYRELGRNAGILVFVLDVAKGAAMPLLLRFIPALSAGIDPRSVLDHAVFTGVAAVLGHSFSPFLRFKGGKGVATGLGVVLGTTPLVGVAGFGVFVVVAALTKIVSIASILGSLAIVACAVLTRQPGIVTTVYACVVALVILRHVPNIKRLLKGEEKKLDFKKKARTETEAKEGG